MKRFITRLNNLLLIGALLLLTAPLGWPARPAQAAPLSDYYFEVPQLLMQVFVQPDASLKIEYDITFINRGEPIEYVDVGMPTSNYSTSNMRASINGVELYSIHHSEYVDPGVEVYLGNQAIPNGGTGTLHFEATIPDLVYQDVTQGDYASLQVTPTWFGSQYVTGNGKIDIVIHLLPGIDPTKEAVKSQGVDYLLPYLKFDDHYAVSWQFDGPPTSAHLVGLSFPKRGLNRVVQQNLFDLANRFLATNPNLSFILVVLLAVSFTFWFFRMSGGTGWVLWLIGGGVGFFVLQVAPFAVLCLLPLLVGLIIYNEVQMRNRKPTYLPAIAQVEGGGIKRGLTAPEAALLLEMPLPRVLGLVIFGLLKKGVLKQIDETPLAVELAEPFRVSGGDDLMATQKLRLKAAQDQGVVLHPYEHEFLAVVAKTPGPVEKMDFGPALKDLMTHVAQRVKGFDLSDTQDYYKQIVQRAVTEAKSVGDVAQREKQLDRDMEWILMNPQPNTNIFSTGGWNYRPLWIRGPIGGSNISFGSPGKGSSSPSGGTTSLGQLSAGFAGWAENTMGGLASSIMPGSVQVKTPGAVMDFSGADKVTADILKELGKASTSSGSGRSGGGSGRSCACACAGCACACACAGGGR